MVEGIVSIIMILALFCWITDEPARSIGKIMAGRVKVAEARALEAEQSAKAEQAKLERVKMERSLHPGTVWTPDGDVR